MPCRYDVEHDLRDVKVTLDIESIRAQSVEMFQKELLTSLAAYNLVVQFRRQAAALAGLPPRRLSFTEMWNTFESFLLHQPPCPSPPLQIDKIHETTPPTRKVSAIGLTPPARRFNCF